MTQTYSPVLNSPMEEQLRQLYDRRLQVDGLIEALEAYGCGTISTTGFERYPSADPPLAAPRMA